MKIILQIISILALIFTVIPAIFYLTGSMELDQTKWILLISTLVWFICAPLWSKIKKEQQEV